MPAVATERPTVGVMWLTSETSVDPPSAGSTPGASFLTVVSRPVLGQLQLPLQVLAKRCSASPNVGPRHRLEVPLHRLLQRAIEQVLVQPGGERGLVEVCVASAAPSAIFTIQRVVRLDRRPVDVPDEAPEAGRGRHDVRRLARTGEDVVDAGGRLDVLPHQVHAVRQQFDRVERAPAVPGVVRRVRGLAGELDREVVQRLVGGVRRPSSPARDATRARHRDRRRARRAPCRPCRRPSPPRACRTTEACPAAAVPP